MDEIEIYLLYIFIFVGKGKHSGSLMTLFDWKVFYRTHLEANCVSILGEQRLAQKCNHQTKHQLKHIKQRLNIPNYADSTFQRLKAD